MTTAVVAAARAADSQSPWPGLAAFEEGDGAFFKGREEAIATLARLIAREDLSLLWGFSGLGKTSLLRAGLFPRLREADIFPVYVRLRYARSGADGPAPASLVDQCLDQMRLAADCWRYEIPEPAPSGTMWEYVRRRDHQFWGPGDRLVTPLLVFDQFEELFTPDRTRELTAETIDAFFRDISQAVTGCPPQWLLDAGRTTAEDGDYVYRPGALKVLLSFREDYLAHVTGLKTLVDAIDGNHYRLVSMTVDEAATAVYEAGGHLIEGATAEDKQPLCREIVARVASAAPGPHLSPTVDPAFLSLFCRRLNEQRLHDGRAVIDRAQVRGAEASQIISNFYDTSMAQVGEATRRFVESSLVLAESRSRDSAAEVLALRSGATREDLDFLVDDKRILRREQNTRFGQTRLELTHDILVEPALAARERREAEERRAEQERERAAQLQREREAADRLRQAREIELLRQRVALEERLEAERKRGDEQTAARLEAERQREALEAAERERRLAEAVRTVRRRKRVVTWGLSGLLLVVVLGWFAVDRVRTLQEQQRRVAVYLERAVDDAASARPAQALARLAAVMRERPDHTVARSLALDLLLRRTWLLPVATPSLAGGHALTALNSDGDLAATVSNTGALQVWEVETGAATGPARAHGAPLSLVRFTPAQPDWILTVATDGVARVWPARGGPAIATIRRAAPIVAAAFGPMPVADGSKADAVISTASSDGWLTVWRLNQGQPPRELHRLQLESAPSVLELSPDGLRLLAIAGHSVTIWDPTSGKPVHIRHEPTEIVSAAAFSPDSRLVATAARVPSATSPYPSSERLVVWRTETGTALGEACCAVPANRLVFGRSGGQLLSIGYRPQAAAAVWRVSQPDARQTGGAALERVASLPVSDPDVDGAFVDDELLVMLSNSGSVRLADAGTGLPLVIPLRLAATSIRLDDSRRRLVVTSRDRPPTAWALHAPAVEVDLGHSQPVVSAQFSPTAGSAQILTASLDGAARIWTTSGGLPEAEFYADDRLLGAEYSPDGRFVLTNDGRFVRVWKTSGEPVGRPIASRRGRFILARFDPTGARIVTASDEGPAWVWNAATGEPVREIATAGSLWSAEFSPAGDRIVTASDNDVAEVWEVATGARVGTPLTHDRAVVGARFSLDGTRLVTASADTTAKVWTVGSSAPPIVLSHSDRVTSARFASDGARVVTTSNDWTARIWTLTSPVPRVLVLAHEAPVDFVELDPSGDRLLTVSTRANTIRLWDATTGQPLTQITPPPSLLWSARFSPNGQRVVTASDDGYARVYDVPTGAAADGGWLAELCEAVSGRRVEPTGATVAVALDDQIARLAAFRAVAKGSPRGEAAFQQRFLRWLLLGEPPAF